MTQVLIFVNIRCGSSGSDLRRLIAWYLQYFSIVAATDI